MKRYPNLCRKALVCFELLLLILPVRSSADVSVTQQGMGEGREPKATWTRTFWISGLKMRVESKHGSESHVYIYDLVAGKRYRLEAKQKKVFVMDLGAEERRRLIDVPLIENLRRVIKPTGKQLEIGGMACDEYTFDLRAPTLPYQGISYVLHDSGTVCVSQVIPGGVDITNFVHEAQKRVYIAAAAVCSPTNSAIGSYFYGDQSNTNTVLLSAKTESAYERGLSGEVQGMTFVEKSMAVTAISNDPIPDKAFQIPPDWKTKKESVFR